ncbi:bifunctional helix-turn-helix transcriptional regulator/GNAT family N-acetyltransferase [Maritimibacter sp. DP1N21-5]|uniref:bifunctional helix-turn-helix transcriptional regulator/GNAT family N-acetyltransferase n=1 Tax=Maritimibacter sp. DP1N21-5 TaxID=2836867 RepID=UPI001C469ACA|nr:bifunctional helix-turn-helix transcriptional regulator/GNAT family N-acetyltransferase [Maritimibacter sp. DP1N21-5]MBV7409284.1 bifunctional helix-turn-helix transcriptional regulator/GNAT family N-acetyltransferase [Maritimibacter sp. DP1N21-5]
MSAPTEIDRIRRFQRAVTRETGVMDQSFLGRGRPLGAARVLNAIGRGMTEVAAIRDYLGLDSGLMSRLLRGLEEEGLIATTIDSADARRRVARFTPKGQAEFAAYEALSNDRAARLLQSHPKAGELLAAMDLIASALGQHAVDLVETDPRAPEAIYCLTEYYAELARRFERGFEVHLSKDPEATTMMAPQGAFFVAMSDGLPIGCGGLKGHFADAEPWGEVKRLWIAPSARGLGLAKRFMTRIEISARDLGMAALRLDTNSQLPEAVSLYRRLGWTEIDRFNDDPYPDHFFEKRL